MHAACRFCPAMRRCALDSRKAHVFLSIQSEAKTAKQLAQSMVIAKAFNLEMLSTVVQFGIGYGESLSNIGRFARDRKC
jgi:hypothetical protein